MTPRRLRVVLTGGSGFLGRNVVRRLCASGAAVCLVARRNAAGAFPLPPAENTSFLDAALDAVALGGEISRFAPDLALHLSTSFVADHAPEQVADLIDSNIAFPTRFVEALAGSGVKRLLNVSTTWQHHRGAPYDPINLYAATKQAFEDILRFYHEARGLSVLTLVLNDTYGPHDKRPKLFAALATARESPRPVLFSPGEQIVDLTYVEDAVDALVLGVERLMVRTDRVWERFAVRADQPIRLRDLAALYATICEADLDIAWGARRYRDREMMSPPTVAEVLPGWSPKISLSDGIRIMVEADVRDP